MVLQLIYTFIRQRRFFSKWKINIWTNQIFEPNKEVYIYLILSTTSSVWTAVQDTKTGAWTQNIWPVLLPWIQESYNMIPVNFSRIPRQCCLFPPAPPSHYVSEQHLEPDQVHNSDHSKYKPKLKRIQLWINIKLNTTTPLRLQWWNTLELSAGWWIMHRTQSSWDQP